jgi:hypothetical protein
MKQTILYLALDIPVNVSDVTGGSLAGTHTFLSQHVVNVHKVVV